MQKSMASGGAPFVDGQADVFTQVLKSDALNDQLVDKRLVGFLQKNSSIFENSVLITIIGNQIYSLGNVFMLLHSFKPLILGTENKVYKTLVPYIILSLNTSLFPEQESQIQVKSSIFAFYSNFSLMFYMNQTNVHIIF